MFDIKINKVFVDPRTGINHFIDEYVLKAVDTAPYENFLKQDLGPIWSKLHLPIIKKLEGGYIGKLHSWNGQVPGPYGKEVGALLKAGTEGVYQNDYIKSLQQNTGDTISVGGITLNFNELPKDPKQFGNQLMQGIKQGRGRLIQSA